MVGATGLKIAALLVASALFSACSFESNSDSASAGASTTDTSAPSTSSSSAAGSSASSVSTTLVWSPPTANTNGSMLTNLAGYKIYFGRSASALNEVINVQSAGITSYVVDKLVSGTYYFALSAYNAAGVESAMQLVGSKTIP
jgi:hypothetical protein